MTMSFPQVYKPFYIWIRGTIEAAEIAVDGAPGGDLPQAPLDLRELPAVQQLVNRMRSGAGDPTTIATLGQSLYRILFTSSLRDLYQRSLGRLVDGERLRLLLRIDPPALAALPWELIYDPIDNVFLALDSLVSVARYLPQPRRPSALTRAGPLRVLVVLASPNGLPALQISRELALMVMALQTLPPDLVVLDVLIDGPTAASTGVDVSRIGAPTPKALIDAIAGGYDVLHYGGHGMIRADGEGLLALENDDRSAVFFDAGSLGIAVRGTPLRLAVLTACRTAASAIPGPTPVPTEDPASALTTTETSRGAAIPVRADPWVTVVPGPTPLPVAPTLVRAGLSAVTAMQTDLPDESAVAFSRSFYTAVARNAPIDAAMSDARKALRLTTLNLRADWGIPVLFLQEVGDGRLWVAAPQQRRPDSQLEEGQQWETATTSRVASAPPSANTANSRQADNIPHRASAQGSTGATMTERDSSEDSAINQAQYGGIRFGDNTQVQGFIVGGDLILHGLDDATRQLLKRLLDQLVAVADDARSLPRDIRVAVMTQAEAAKQDIDAPDARARLSNRLEGIVKVLKTMSDGVAAAAPLYEILKNLGILIGLRLP